MPETNLKLTICSINVNSFNVSTISSGNAKVYLKIEGITAHKYDIIFITDCRLANKGKEVEKLMRLSLNGNYELFYNSNMEKRGVCIAIKKNLGFEIQDTMKDALQNYIFLRIKIQGHDLLLGCIYGPNGNNPVFFNEIINICKRSEVNYILGGDFNTIIDRRIDEGNLDRIGNGNIPNYINSNIINQWLDEGLTCDPFRILYPEEKTYSHTPFRRLDGECKNRLDFF